MNIYEWIMLAGLILIVVSIIQMIRNKANPEKKKMWTILAILGVVLLISPYIILIIAIALI